MADSSRRILVVATAPLDGASRDWLLARTAGGDVTALWLAPNSDPKGLPASCRLARRGDYEDLDSVRREFLAFLDAWPRTLFSGRAFEEDFTTADGYSLWWVGPGLKRHPDHGVFPKVRDACAAARAIEALAPAAVVLHADDPAVAAAVESKCARAGISCEYTPGGARPTRPFWSGRLPWLIGSLAWLLGAPWFLLARALICRLLVAVQRPTPDDAARPAVVMTAMFPREIRLEANRVRLDLWTRMCEVLSSRADHVRQLFLLHTNAQRMGRRRLVAGLFHSAWPVLRRLEGALPLPERFACWEHWPKAAVRQAAAAFRYVRLEGREEFRRSFELAGCDLAPLYVPLLRQAVRRIATWSLAVAAAAKSLAWAGNVKAVLAYGEMYGLGQVVVAAARRRRIPVIGIQHGTLFPMHLVYTLPPGQVAGAPMPDFFAAYGEYAREVMSRDGAYPAERVWVTGGPRFDRLVLAPPDRDQARSHLHLPLDKTIVLFATQKYPWFLEAGRALFAALARRDDCLVCVKTHPADVPLERYRALAEEAGAGNVRYFSDRFDQLLAVCDVLVSGSSTAVFEAILLGRRTICVNFSDEPDRYPYVADGGSLSAQNADQLRQAVDRAIALDAQADWESGRRRFLLRHAGASAAGEAAETLARTLLDAVGE